MKRKPDPSRVRTPKAGVWATGGRAVGVGGSVLLAAVVARSTSEANAGSIFLLLSLSGLLVALIQWGANYAVVREVAPFFTRGELHRAARSAGGRIAQVVFLGCLLSLAAAIPGVAEQAAHVVGDPQITDAFVILAIFSAIRAAASTISEALRGSGDLAWASLLGGPDFQILASTLLALAWAAVGGNLTVLDAASALLAASLPGMALGLLRLNQRFGKEAVAALLSGLHHPVVKPASALLGVNLLTIIVGQGDIWMVSRALGSSAVASYALAVKFAALVGTPLLIVNAIMAHRLASMLSAGKRGEASRASGVQARRAFIAGSLIYAAAFIGLERDWLSAVLGDGYQSVHEVFAILGFGQLVNLAVGPAGLALLMGKAERSLVCLSALSALTTLSATAFGGARWGLVGAAWGSTCALSLYNIGMAILASRKLGANTSIVARGNG